MYDVQTVMTSFYYKNKINCYNLIINDFQNMLYIFFLIEIERRCEVSETVYIFWLNL